MKFEYSVLELKTERQESNVRYIKKKKISFRVGTLHVESRLKPPTYE